MRGTNSLKVKKVEGFRRVPYKWYTHTHISTNKDTSTPTEGHHIQNVPREDLSPLSPRKWLHTCAREYVYVLCLGRGCSEVKLVLLKVYPVEINHSGPGCIIAAINHWTWPLFPLSCEISEERWVARLLSAWWLPQMACTLHIFQSACISSQVNMEMAIASLS